MRDGRWSGLPRAPFCLEMPIAQASDLLVRLAGEFAEENLFHAHGVVGCWAETSSASARLPDELQLRSKLLG